MSKTIYSNKRNATRKKIDSVYIEHFRLSGDDDLTVKEICKRAGINRSTFYTYYKDAVEIREQIEERLISQLEKRLTTVADRYFDDLDVIIREIMEFNRDNGYLPLLLISAGSNSFLYRISNIAIEMLTSGYNLSHDDHETITRLYVYHFAGLSMLIRQMKEDMGPNDEDFEEMTQELRELLRPVVYNGILPVVKEHIKD